MRSGSDQALTARSLMQAFSPSTRCSPVPSPSTAAAAHQYCLLQGLNAPQAQPLCAESRTAHAVSSHRQSRSCVATVAAGTAEPEAASRADDVLPDSLTDALTQASESTVLALQGVGGRYLVEVLIPEFWDPAAGAVFSEEGDQQRFWKLTRKFAEELAERTDGAQIAVLYPDSGVASMLQHQWQDAPFRIASLGDRNPVKDGDEIVILAAPDPQGLSAARTVTAEHEENKHIIMFNPRLSSFDAGVGLNVRRIRSEFLSRFLTTYSLRPIGSMGSVFKRFPGSWQVFIEDPATPGRYNLAAERDTRPAGDVLDEIINKALGRGGVSGEDGESAGLFDKARQQLNSLAGFMRALTR